MGQADDEHEVRRLAAQYADAVNRRDAEGMAAVFAANGIIEKPGFGDPVQGVEKILKRYKRLQRERDFLAQLIHSGIVEIEGDEAKARWWFCEIKKVRDTDDWLYMIGVYQDHAVKLEEGWRFAKRSQTTIFEHKLNASAISSYTLPNFISLFGQSGPVTENINENRSE